MRVHELIAELRRFDPEAFVMHKGAKGAIAEVMSVNVEELAPICIELGHVADAYIELSRPMLVKVTKR